MGKENERKIIPITKFLLPTLTKSEQKAAEFLLQYPHEVTKLSLAEFADNSGSSQASIIRFCRRMGVDGYSQMKANLQNQLAEYSETGVQINDLQPLKPGMDMAEIVDSVFAMNIQILKDTAELITEDYEKAFDALLKTKRIFFFSIGDAVIPCKFAEYKFRKLGYTCCADLDADMQIIDACNMGKGDVAIAISHSGNSRQVVVATKIAKERGATTICITKLEKSELIKWCDIKLFTAMPGNAFEKEVIARRIAEQAILESLYLGILERNEPGSDQKLKTLSKALRANKI